MIRAIAVASDQPTRGTLTQLGFAASTISNVLVAILIYVGWVGIRRTVSWFYEIKPVILGGLSLATILI